MTAHTILLDFSVAVDKIENVASRKKILEDVETVINKQIPEPLKRLHSIEEDKGFISLLLGPRNSFVTVRGYSHGLVTINIEYFKQDDESPLLTLESSNKIEDDLGGMYIHSRAATIPSIKRGQPFTAYFRTSDERILEYDVMEVLFDKRTEHQKVQIFKTMNFGNMLVLDDLQNLAESDLIYTETLMQRGLEIYKDKEILILGGGDGALLWELLKEDPKFVTMIEIDDVVMQACRKYMSSCCGTCLDNYKGKKYEIIVDDCVKYLKKYIKDGQKFDYVFADLTDIPLSPSPVGEVWAFIREILNLSMQVLNDGGKYMTHGNGVSSNAALTMYENQLKELSVPVKFSRKESFVPSFMELWVFYQVWKQI